LYEAAPAPCERAREQERESEQTSRFFKKDVWSFRHEGEAEIRVFWGYSPV
jgi:hypothetical protein